MRTSGVRIGVIGLGFMGSRWARVLSEHSGARLELVSDLREEVGRKVAERFETRFVGDPLEAASDGSLDGVVVCTPEHLHVGPALAAMEAGKAVMVEKPLAHTVEKAERIRDRARQIDVPVLVGHILRFEPRYAAAHRAVEAGEVGAVQAIRGERVGLLGTQQILHGRTSIALYLGVHEFDLARWFAGEVDTVAAHRSEGVVQNEGYDVDDLYSTLLKFKSGAHGVATLGWIVPDSFPGRGLVSLTVIGEQGVVRIDQDQLGYVQSGRSGPIHVDFFFEGEVQGASYGVLSIEADHFLRCARGETEPLVSVEDGTEAVRISLAVEQSALTGKPLSLCRAGA